MNLEPPCDLCLSSFEEACNMLGIEPKYALIFAPDSLADVAGVISKKYKCELTLVPAERNSAWWAVLPPTYIADCVVSAMSS